MSSIISTTFSSLPSLRDIVLPTPTVYATLLNIFQYFPFVTLIQWLTPWHPAGKTSYKDSPFNIPGRLAWFIMEIVGPLNLVYILSNLPQRFNIQTLPLPNKLVASLYVLHYVNRAIISPFFAAPSMSPIHIFVMVSAIFFNWFNSTCLAGWIVGYTVDIRYPRALSLAKGSHSSLDDALTAPEKVLDDSLSNKSCATLVLPGIGLALFIIGMVGNIYAERTLFSLRREEADKQAYKDSATVPDSKEKPNQKPNKYHKIYVIPPRSGLFRSILYPHYVLEWLEWTGFALFGTFVFPSLSPPSFLSSPILPDVLGMTSETSSGYGSGGQTLHLAPWLIPAVSLAERLRVPVVPLPAIIFVANAVANMLPHARWGRKWYVEKFGERRVGGRGAVVPFVSWL